MQWRIGGGGGQTLFQLSHYHGSKDNHGQPFAYSLYGVLFLMYSKLAIDLLQNFHIFLAKNRFFLNSKSQVLKLLQLFDHRGLKENSLHLHIISMMYYFLYVAKWPLIFQRSFKQKIDMLLILLGGHGIILCIQYGTHRPIIFPKMKF